MEADEKELARRALIDAVVTRGFPAELGDLLAERDAIVQKKRSERVNAAVTEFVNRERED